MNFMENIFEKKFFFTLDPIHYSIIYLLVDAPKMTSESRIETKGEI